MAGDGSPDTPSYPEELGVEELPAGERKGVAGNNG